MNNKRLHRLLLFLVIGIIAISNALGQEEHVCRRLNGYHFALDSVLTAQDDKYGTSLWSTIQKNISVTDLVSLQLNEDTALFLIGSHTLRVDVEITYYSASGIPDSLAKSLFINYESASAKPYNFRSTFKFSGGYKVKTRILNVFLDGASISPLMETFPKAFELVEDIYINRIYYFDCSAPMLPMHTPDTTNKRLIINWSRFAGANEYDLEYTMYDDSSYVIKHDTNNSYTDYGFLFTGNATRVTVMGCEYAFSLVYNPGRVFYRIRPIHYDSAGNRIEGTWSSDTSCIFHNYKNQFNWHGHENTMNWQYTAAFAEEGKRKEVTSYFDGSLRNRQSVTLNNTQNKAIVGETIYDFQGRPAVTTLPVPVDSGKIVFYDRFNVNSHDSEYSRKDFDTGACGYIPVGMDSTLRGVPRGSSAYYSDSNPDKNSGFDQFLPDAQGYPFTMTEYTPDNTGRISRQSIAGKTHRLGSGRETKYYYGKPAQQELDRLFGNEVGNNSHYLENMVMDADSQISVSYIDANGKTIATALAGAKPSNLQPLGSYSSAGSLRISLLDADSIHPTNTSTFSSYSLMASNAGDYHFAYQLLPGNYTDTSCGSAHVCTDCLYDVQLIITNSCGCDSALRVRYDSNLSYLDAFDTLCGHQNILDTFSVNLSPGQYNISRLITVDPQAISFYTSEFQRKATCVKSYSTFLTNAIASTNFSGCSMTCASCYSALGSLASFKNKYITELHNGGETISNHQDTLDADTAYAQAYAQCGVLCAYTSPCSGLYSEMLNDVSLGGQYCLDTLLHSFYYPKDSASMFRNTYYRNPSPAYVNSSGQLDSVVINGLNYPPQLLTVTQFVQNWKPSWASSLVVYHPEYCYYSYCISDSASNRWDYNFENANTYSAACSAGYLFPLGPVSFACSGCATNIPDPYFKKGGLGQADSTYIRNKLIYFASSGGITLSLWATVAMAAIRQADSLQGMNITYALTAADTTFCGNCAGCENMEWRMFEGIYSSIKHHIQDSLENIYVEGCNPYANCVGSASGCDNYDAPKVARNINSLNASKYAFGPTSTNKTTQLHYADSVMTATCDSNCHSFVTYWYRQLDSNCNKTLVSANSARLIARLMAVCVSGCNGSHPFGASTTPNAMPDDSGDISFEDVIHAVLGVTYADTLCNGAVITMPPPYYDSNGTAGPPITYYKPTPCQCGNIDTAYTIYSRDSAADHLKYPNFGEFLSKYYGDSVSPANAYALRTLCHGSCFYATTPLQMPLWMSCCQDSDKPQQVTIAGGKWKTDTSLGIPDSSSAQRTFGAVSFSINDTGYVYGGYYKNASGTLVLFSSNLWRWTNLTKWKLQAPQPEIPKAGGIGFAIAGKGYVGLGGNTPTNYKRDLEQYDSYTNSWATMTNFPDTARINAFSFVIADSAYVGCGDSLGTYFNDFCKYVPSSLGGTWTSRTRFPGGPRFSMVAFSIGNYGYAGCGKDKFGHLHNDMWKFDPGTNSWTSITAFPVKTGISASVTFTLHGKGFVGLGYVGGSLEDSNSYTNQFWEYDPAVNKWYSVVPFTGSRSADGIGFSLGNYGYAGAGANEFYGVEDSRNAIVADFAQFSIEDSAQLASPQCCISCINIDTAMAHFAKAYPKVNDSSVNYITLLTTYMNQYFGFDMTFGEYLQFYKQCSSGDTLDLGDGKHLPLLLCNRAANEPTPITDTNPCYTSLMLDAQYTAQEEYVNYVDSVKNAFEANYIKHCMQIDDSFHVTMPFDEYHYTLYYYDQAENLVKTVPPQGVHPITAAASLDSIQKYRAGVAGYNPVYPKDSMQTKYFYNTLNSPIKQQTPDGDSVHFWYDRLGRIVLSQNALQRNLTYSYTQYDALDRIIEVGQVSTVPANLPSCFHCVGCTVSYGVLPVLPDTFSRNDAELQNFINTGTKTQVTHTYYDTAQFTFIPLAQQNLRKRISTISYQDVYDNLYTGTNWVHEPQRYDNAIHYTYDIEGYVASILIDVPHDSIVKQRYKRIDYYYDLISGNINETVYQHDSIDQFIHSYEFDADNRTTDVYTSHDSLYWEHDASYEYYDHDPMAREVIGRRQVQGVDYVYTLNGWIKGMNSSITNPSYDMGFDGDVHSSNSTVARDAFGYTINYFNGDYRSIASTNFEVTGLPITPLYNSNISGATYSIQPLSPKTIGYTYGYDQLNRLVSEKAFKGVDTVHNLWIASDSISDLREKVNYDENGNILLYLRHGNTAIGPLAMDSLTYHYNKGMNQLNYIADAVPSSNYPNDLDNQHKNNYRYNAIGERAKDSTNGIDTIMWTMYGKVKEIKKHNHDSIIYMYDPLGNKLEERYYPHSGTADTTKYTREATGNIIAIYDRKKDTVKLKEWEIYGNKRIGEFDTLMVMKKPASGVGTIDSITYSYLEGQKQYELVNHLGNVLITVSDKKIPVDTISTDTLAKYYLPNIITSQDYYPFGTLQPGRSYTLSYYNFGFNGKLKDDSIYGKGNFYDYGMRFYDWTDQFWSIDPLEKKYPYYSPYMFAGDKPIQSIDMDGLEDAPHNMPNDRTFKDEEVGPKAKHAETSGVTGFAVQKATKRDPAAVAPTPQPQKLGITVTSGRAAVNSPIPAPANATIYTYQPTVPAAGSTGGPNDPPPVNAQSGTVILTVTPIVSPVTGQLVTPTVEFGKVSVDANGAVTKTVYWTNQNTNQATSPPIAFNLAPGEQLYQITSNPANIGNGGLGGTGFPAPPVKTGPNPSINSKVEEPQKTKPWKPGKLKETQKHKNIEKKSNS